MNSYQLNLEGQGSSQLAWVSTSGLDVHLNDYENILSCKQGLVTCPIHMALHDKVVADVTFTRFSHFLSCDPVRH